MVLADPVRVGDVLAQLGELGLGLSLDDFGTGFSSLTHLKSLPVGEVKIDRSFVGRMTTDPVDAAIVQATIQLAHRIGIRVVAEGIEDQVTWSSLVANQLRAGPGVCALAAAAGDRPRDAAARPAAARACRDEPTVSSTELAELSAGDDGHAGDGRHGDAAHGASTSVDGQSNGGDRAAATAQRQRQRHSNGRRAERLLRGAARPHRADALAPDDGRRDRGDRRAHDPRRARSGWRTSPPATTSASTSTARSSRRCPPTWTRGARTRAGRACWAAPCCTSRSRSASPRCWAAPTRWCCRRSPTSTSRRSPCWRGPARSSSTRARTRRSTTAARWRARAAPR